MRYLKQRFVGGHPIGDFYAPDFFGLGGCPRDLQVEEGYAVLPVVVAHDGGAAVEYGGALAYAQGGVENFPVHNAAYLHIAGTFAGAGCAALAVAVGDGIRADANAQRIDYLGAAGQAYVACDCQHAFLRHVPNIVHNLDEAFVYQLAHNEIGVAVHPEHNQRAVYNPKRGDVGGQSTELVGKRLQLFYGALGVQQRAAYRLFAVGRKRIAYDELFVACVEAGGAERRGGAPRAVAERNAADVYQIAARRQVAAHIDMRTVDAHHGVVRGWRRWGVGDAGVFGNDGQRPVGHSARLRAFRFVGVGVERIGGGVRAFEPHTLVDAPRSE